MGTARTWFQNVLKTFVNKAGIINGGQRPNPEFDGLLEKLVSESHTDNLTHVPVTRRPTYREVKNLDPRKKVEMAFYLARGMADSARELARKKVVWGMDPSLTFKRAYETLLFNMLRMNLDFEEADLIALLEFFHNNSSREYFNLRFRNWPVGLTAIHFEKYVRANGLSSNMRDAIMTALAWPEFNENTGSWGSDVQKAKLRLQVLVSNPGRGGSVAPPIRLVEDDVIGEYINDYVDRLEAESRDRVYEIFNLALTADGARPASKFTETSKSIISHVDSARFKLWIRDWFSQLISARPISESHTSSYGGREYTWVSHTFLADRNATLIKGLVWSATQFHDDATVNLIARLAERSFEKIPGVGPTCASVGNACFYYLANCHGTKGISHLSRLKLKINQNSARQLIARYLQEESQKRGLSSAELEERSVPDFGLTLGTIEESFGDYKVKLSATGIGKTELQWLGPDGKPQKSIPAFVKNDKRHGAKLQKLKSIAKQIQKYSTAQRDRIDRCYIENREWTYDDFFKYYLNHGLVSFVARRLIWILNNEGVSISAIPRNGRWEDVRGNEVSGIGGATKVRLWHPLFADTEEVMLWRRRLAELGVQQPMKQAHREIYILTEAELVTRTYSNRMAAHVLKQHQLNALTGVRGWKYKLLGNFDDGRGGSETARINLPAHKLTAEFWINDVYGENLWNDAGIWNYVSTDQIRFVGPTGEPVNLIDVPRIVFSEIMRDVDLFVGVCSVGNDSQWLDRGGMPQYRDYWTTYSFGDLTEVAKTRKTVLEQLLPRLKIRGQAVIDGKFLRIRGKLREYKIHIGSTNILMEPDDRYLCIVPARTNETVTDKVFLPFEGDRGLSVIISKAILLAEDDRIADPAIVSQISRR